MDGAAELVEAQALTQVCASSKQCSGQRQPSGKSRLRHDHNGNQKSQAKSRQKYSGQLGAAALFFFKGNRKIASNLPDQRGAFERRSNFRFPHFDARLR